MRNIVNWAAIGVGVLLLFLLITGCAQQEQEPRMTRAQQYANTYTEVCMNGRVYYAWEGRSYMAGNWTFSPKIISANVTVNC